MRKIFFLIPLVLTVFLFAYEDLGKSGSDYPIIETNLQDIIERELSAINVDKLKQDIKENYYRQAKGEDNLPKCSESSFRKELDFVVLEEDIYSPTGKLYQKKGTKMLATIPTELNICFVYGKDKEMLKNQINFFEEKTNGKCTYLISGISVLEAYDMFPNKVNDLFPAKKYFENRFNVNCYPSLVNLIQNDRNITEYNIDEFNTGVNK